jgi:hypothetical protein
MRHYATSPKVEDSIPDEEIGFFKWPNPSTVPLGSSQPLTKMSTKNLRVGKRRPTRKAANLTAIFDRLSQNVGERLTTLWASKASYRDSFVFFIASCLEVTCVFNSCFILKLL